MSNWAQKAEEKVRYIHDRKKNYFSDEKKGEKHFGSMAEVSYLLKVLRSGLVDVDSNVDVQRNDPTSPLFSCKSFEDLKLTPHLLKGVYAMGFNVPSRIQETALPILLADPPKNLIAQSQSGTGKSAAFVLAMLSRVDTNRQYPQVICLSPTYELAVQTGEVAVTMARFCKDTTFRYAVRGEVMGRQSVIKEHVIIGTPGKIYDWCVKMKLIDMSKIKVFVLDEADVMISRQGHQDQCIRIQKELSPKCQMLLFSATYIPKVMEFAQEIVPNSDLIRLRHDQLTLDNIHQYSVKCSNAEAKYKAIQTIYGCISIGQVIIFCATRVSAAWLGMKMTEDGHAVAVLSGDQTTDERLNVIDNFRAGMQKVLIATNVLSRGIDISQVNVVINYDLPANSYGFIDYNTYLHRIGRTGRFGKSGIAINLIDSEESEKICRRIERYFQKSIRDLDIENIEQVEKIGM